MVLRVLRLYPYIIINIRDARARARTFIIIIIIIIIIIMTACLLSSLRPNPGVVLVPDAVPVCRS
jgi:hypothetical protein